MSLIPLYFSAALVLAAVSEPHSFTIIDFWRGKCDKGDETACDKLAASIRDEQKLEKLNSRASIFQTSIKPEEFLLDKKPNLGKAYPIVIKDYLESTGNQQASKPEEFVIDYCAKHFHDYWLNQKYWWPTNTEDKPDWGTIYVYIVDHYHGICLRQPF